MSDGTFGPDNRFEWEATEAHGYEGQEWGPGEIEDHLDEADQIFYHVHDVFTGEDFYRWVGGPFEDLEGAAEAIADQESAYSETT